MGARLVAEVITMVEGTITNERNGRWRLNAGSEMVITVNGINKDKPIRLVIDLATAKPKNPKVVALADHDSSSVVGYWDKFECMVSAIEADLHLIKPESNAEQTILADAVRVGAQVRAGVPIQVSVGAEAGPNGDWEKVEAGKSVTVNGRTHNGGDGDVPLYILRGGEIYESSIVTFGADSETGRVAAAKSPKPVNSETTMSEKLKVLLGKHPEKHHGLIARCVAEDNDEPTINSRIQAADLADKDAIIKAKDERIAQLENDLKCASEKKAEADDYAPKGTEQQEREVTHKLNLAAKSSDKGVRTVGAEKHEQVQASDAQKSQVTTLTQAMKVMAEKSPELKGFKLRAAARKAYPNAEER